MLLAAMFCVIVGDGDVFVMIHGMIHDGDDGHGMAKFIGFGDLEGCPI